MDNHHEIIADYTASLIGGSLCFGSYPSRELFDALVACGFTLFIDLTTVDDATLLIISQGFDYPYGIDNKEVSIKRYPIADRTPGTIEDARLIVASCMMKLDNGGKVYIHCRGGHGRSAMIAALIVVENGYSPMDAIATVKKAHHLRRVMNDKWRKLGAPQTISQKTFVKNWLTASQKSD